MLESVEKERELSTVWWEWKQVQPLETVWRFLKEELLPRSGNPLLGIYLKNSP